MNLRSAFRILVVVATILAGCGDDAAGTGAGGAASGSGGSGGDAGASGSGGAPSTIASAAASTAATTTAASTTTATGGEGGSGEGGGGGSPPGACDEVLVGDGEAAPCRAEAPPGAMPLDDVTLCPTTIDRTWPATIFAVDVTAGDCLQMRADNAGSAGTDLFGALVDPGGDSLLFDDEVPCTVSADGTACPEGAITVTTTGRAHVIVGSFEGEGCPPETAPPVQLVVGRNGQDVDLTGAFVCVGDLLEIIP